jgi:hypothetical protein
MATIENIDDVRALRAIAAQLELELRTTQAFMAMMIVANDGKIEVPEQVAEQVPDDFEISVTRNESVATFTVVSGEEAAELRKVTVSA